MTSSGRWTLIALAGLCLAALGATAAIALTHPFTPASARVATEPSDIAVATQGYDDPREVQISLRQGPPRSLIAPASGRVTALSCSAGGTVTSGSSPVSIDGVAKLALATPVPPWRDLPRGTRGSDVTALQTALTSLGHDIRSDAGAVGQATLDAFAAALRKAGSTGTIRDVVPLSEIVWLPDPKAQIATCTVSVGQHVSQGDMFAGFTPGLSGATITPPADLVAGKRDLVVGTTTIPLDGSGSVTQPGLQALTATAAYRDAMAKEPMGEVLGTYRLAEPVDIAVVPPSAVIGSPGRQCVVSGTRSISVVVVGSQLGKSYVRFDDTAPCTVRISPPSGARCG